MLCSRFFAWTRSACPAELNLHETRRLQVVLEDDLLRGVEDLLHIGFVRGARDMVINLLVLAVVLCRVHLRQKLLQASPSKPVPKET